MELEILKGEEHPPKPAEMLLTGESEFDEPSLLSLVSLLFCLGQNDSDPKEMAWLRAIPAFMFLLRNHPPTLERLRALADEAKHDDGMLADAMLHRAEAMPGGA